MDKIPIDTIDKCERAIQKLKEQEYCIFHYGLDWYEPEGFEICYLGRDGKQVEFYTHSEDVQRYFIKHGMLRWEQR